MGSLMPLLTTALKTSIEKPPIICSPVKLSLVMLTNSLKVLTGTAIFNLLFPVLAGVTDSEKKIKKIKKYKVV